MATAKVSWGLIEVLVSLWKVHGYGLVLEKFSLNYV